MGTRRSTRRSSIHPNDAGSSRRSRSITDIISAVLTSNRSSLRQGNYLRQIGAAVTSNPSTLTLDPAIGNEIREASQTPREDTEEMFQTLRELCRREDRVRHLRERRGEIVGLLRLMRTLDPQYARYARPADRAAVQQLPQVLISEEHINNDNSMCPICRDQFLLGEEARIMQCGHMYHKTCIFTWLGSRHTCPLCRFEMPT
jgi:hypothetical protein